MITLIIGLVIGFIAGALVFRNNAKKAEAIVQKGEAVVDKANLAVKNFKK
jgi:F0F1-type ATP synthase assembly protein I